VSYITLEFAAPLADFGGYRSDFCGGALVVKGEEAAQDFFAGGRNCVLRQLR